MSTINATNIVADALVGNASANAITVRGEGSATTSLQQGLAKAWCSLDGTTSDASFKQAFNMGTVTDNGTGNFTVNYTNPMSNLTYSAQVTAGHAIGVTGDVVATFHSDSSIATTSCKFTAHSGGTNRDVPFNFCNIHGDLA